MSGHPRVEKGHSAEENQVSRVSSSCFRAVQPHFGQAAGSSRLTTISPQSGQYHAGIRCPHHSWREIHQSRIFSIQL